MRLAINKIPQLRADLLCFLASWFPNYMGVLPLEGPSLHNGLECVYMCQKINTQVASGLSLIVTKTVEPGDLLL